MEHEKLKILGINFFNGNVESVVRALNNGGLLVVPAAPALIAIKKDHDYYRALLDADIVIADSGYMALIWNIFKAKANHDYLDSEGFNLQKESSYIAPLYDKSNVTDIDLLRMVEQQKPAYIIINLGGGTQEKLGAYLKRNLTYKPAIICTGAAIAFLTGHQASIPSWADKFFLGWLFRCLEKPKLYVPRYFKAFKLFILMMQYGKRAPVTIE
jgi:UDP-N-acetyl-D-mannosaminuronic acid transferase (WecB/TagA/CpsF family)